MTLNTVTPKQTVLAIVKISLTLAAVFVEIYFYFNHSRVTRQSAGRLLVNQVSDEEAEITSLKMYFFHLLSIPVLCVCFVFSLLVSFMKYQLCGFLTKNFSVLKYLCLPAF